VIYLHHQSSEIIRFDGTLNSIVDPVINVSERIRPDPSMNSNLFLPLNGQYRPRTYLNALMTQNAIIRIDCSRLQLADNIDTHRTHLIALIALDASFFLRMHFPTQKLHFISKDHTKNHKGGHPTKRLTRAATAYQNGYDEKQSNDKIICDILPRFIHRNACFGQIERINPLDSSRQNEATHQNEQPRTKNAIANDG
jgi:hypothetical protein